jgi:hypothetical protein
MLDEHHGPATIVACTVVSERSGDRRTVVIAETASGERCVAASGDAAVADRAVIEDVIGTSITVDGLDFRF